MREDCDRVERFILKVTVGELLDELRGSK
uniref:Uncharacterized protein n=1 Tax=Anguilla anguilla TaxID=7936 RepID=A0A0E9THZ7_ANGAN